VHAVVTREIALTDGTRIVYRDDGTEFMGAHFDFFGEASHHDTPLI
jgi:hypothetical protein